MRKNGGRTGAFREKRTQWSQIIKGDEKQRKILVIWALSHSGENCCWFSGRSSNGISLKCLKNRETSGQKFRVYFPCFSGLAGSEAGDPRLVAASLLDSCPDLEKLKALGCRRGVGGQTGVKPEQVETGLEIASGGGRDAPTGEEEGHTLKVKLAAQKGTVLWSGVCR